MNILIPLFFLSLLGGQLCAVPVVPGVYVYLHDVIAVVLVLRWIIFSLKNRTWNFGRFGACIGAFLLAGTLSLVVNAGHIPWGDVLTGSLYLVRWALYAALYFVVINSAVRQDVWVHWLYIFGCLFAVVGLLQFFLYPQLSNLQYLGWDPHYYRLFSTFLDPNYAALMLVLTIVLGSVYWEKHGWRSVICNALLLIALVLTYSRSGYLAFFIASFVYMMLTRRWKILAGVLAFVLLFAVIPRSPLDVTSMLRKVSSEARITNWGTSLSLAARSPVVGYGFNTIHALDIGQRTVSDTGVVSRAGAGIDSSILFLFATTGVVGIVVYVWGCTKAVSMAWGIVKRKKQGICLGISVLSGFAAIILHSFFNNSLFYAWIMIWMWVTLAASERYL